MSYEEVMKGLKNSKIVIDDGKNKALVTFEYTGVDGLNIRLRGESKSEDKTLAFLLGEVITKTLYRMGGGAQEEEE